MKKKQAKRERKMERTRSGGTIRGSSDSGGGGGGGGDSLDARIAVRCLCAFA
jgi:hypothetical protein